MLASQSLAASPSRRRRLLVAAAALGLAFTGTASAAPIANPVATFSGLDKITAQITNFDVYVGETVQFGSLQITPRVCYTRPDTETQRTSVFVEVDQVSLKGTTERIFTGWMFADSPALNAVDDAVYDFWLVDCKQKSSVPPPTAGATTTQPAAAAPRAQSSTTTPAVQPTPAAASGDGGLGALIDPEPAAQRSPDGQ